MQNAGYRHQGEVITCWWIEWADQLKFSGACKKLAGAAGVSSDRLVWAGQEREKVSERKKERGRDLVREREKEREREERKGGGGGGVRDRDGMRQRDF